MKRKVDTDDIDETPRVSTDDTKEHDAEVIEALREEACEELEAFLSVPRQDVVLKAMKKGRAIVQVSGNSLSSTTDQKRPVRVCCSFRVISHYTTVYRPSP